jgi:hypothetical protein
MKNGRKTKGLANGRRQKRKMRWWRWDLNIIGVD